MYVVFETVDREIIYIHTDEVGALKSVIGDRAVCLMLKGAARSFVVVGTMNDVLLKLGITDAKRTIPDAEAIICGVAGPLLVE